MNNATLIALANQFKKQAEKTDLPPGVYPVNETVTIEVKGVVKRSEDCSYTPTVDIPLLMTMALLMEKMGFQRERAKVMLIEAMTEALAAGEHGSETVGERLKDIEKAMEHVRQVTSALPDKIRKGPTNVKVVTKELELV